MECLELKKTYSEVKLSLFAFNNRLSTEKANLMKLKVEQRKLPKVK